jgi:hypothetical protein
MLRKLSVGLSVVALALSGMLAIGADHAAAAAAQISLVVPQGTAFSVLHYDCGGIKELAYVTGFDDTVDPSAGYPTGYVYLTTTCSAGKGTSFTVHNWTADTWDLTGALVAYSVTAPNPSPPSPLSATDPLTGNQIYDSTSPCPGLGGTGSTAYACLQWATSFTPRPKVTGISPGIGPATGGTSVTISGDGFTAATAVDFGSTSAGFIVNSDTSITAVAPADTSGTSPDTLDATVVSPGGTSFTSSSDQFTSYIQPTITSVSPNNGLPSGGYYVTVAGTNFVGTTSVKVGDVVTAFQVLDNNNLSVYIPGSDSGPGDSTSISVTSPGGTSPNTPADQFTYNVVVSPLAPTVTGVSPKYGPPGGGTAVTITGTNFTGATAVDFGTAAVSSFTVVSDTSITTRAPAGTGSVDVTVTNLDGQSATSAADLFTYGPFVTAVTPNVGAAGGGTRVTIKGHNFLGATEVDFGGQSVSFKVNTYGTAITVKSPPTPDSGVQVVDVRVVGPNGTSPIVPADTFSYAAPVLTSITPTSGPAGGNTKVIIKGKYLSDPGNTSVMFDGIPANSFTVNSTGTGITSYTPPEPTTGVVSVDVTVTTTAGGATLSAAFTYSAPTLTSLSPASGSPAGGTIMKLTGTNLYGATSVDFGSSPATITSETPTTITVQTPPGTGAVSVTVTTFAGTSGALTFTY